MSGRDKAALKVRVEKLVASGVKWLSRYSSDEKEEKIDEADARACLQQLCRDVAVACGEIHSTRLSAATAEARSAIESFLLAQEKRICTIALPLASLPLVVSPLDCGRLACTHHERLHAESRARATRWVYVGPPPKWPASHLWRGYPKHGTLRLTGSLASVQCFAEFLCPAQGRLALQVDQTPLQAPVRESRDNKGETQDVVLECRLSNSGSRYEGNPFHSRWSIRDHLHVQDASTGLSIFPYRIAASYLGHVGKQIAARDQLANWARDYAHFYNSSKEPRNERRSTVVAARVVHVAHATSQASPSLQDAHGPKAGVFGSQAELLGHHSASACFNETKLAPQIAVEWQAVATETKDVAAGVRVYVDLQVARHSNVDDATRARILKECATSEDALKNAERVWAESQRRDASETAGYRLFYAYGPRSAPSTPKIGRRPRQRPLRDYRDHCTEQVATLKARAAASTRALSKHLESVERRSQIALEQSRAESAHLDARQRMDCLARAQQLYADECRAEGGDRYTVCEWFASPGMPAPPLGQMVAVFQPETAPFQARLCCGALPCRGSDCGHEKGARLRAPVEEDPHQIRVEAGTRVALPLSFVFASSMCDIYSVDRATLHAHIHGALDGKLEVRVLRVLVLEYATPPAVPIGAEMEIKRCPWSSGPYLRYSPGFSADEERALLAEPYPNGLCFNEFLDIRNEYTPPPKV